MTKLSFREEVILPVFPNFLGSYVLNFSATVEAIRMYQFITIKYETSKSAKSTTKVIYY